MQDLDKTWWIVRLHNGDVTVVRNKFLTIFAEDVNVFTSIWEMRCLQLLL